MPCVSHDFNGLLQRNSRLALLFCGTFFIMEHYCCAEAPKEMGRTDEAVTKKEAVPPSRERWQDDEKVQREVLFQTSFRLRMNVVRTNVSIAFHSVGCIEPPIRPALCTLALLGHDFLAYPNANHFLRRLAHHKKKRRSCFNRRTGERHQSANMGEKTLSRAFFFGVCACPRPRASGACPWGKPIG